MKKYCDHPHRKEKCDKDLDVNVNLSKNENESEAKAGVLDKDYDYTKNVNIVICKPIIVLKRKGLDIYKDYDLDIDYENDEYEEYFKKEAE